MKLTWRTLSLGLGLLALAGTGCDDVTFCTNRDDAGLCPDIDFPQFDGSVGMDGATPPSSDAARADATTVLPDGAVVVADPGIAVADASVDAAVPDAASVASYNVEEFCAAKYRTATAWRDKLDECCVTAANAKDDRSFFLLGGLLYEDGSGMNAESVADCVAKLTPQIGASLAFSPTAAVACADKFASQFAQPPVQCPAAGVTIDTFEAMLGKQSQELLQLPECRAALVGKLGLNAACSGAGSFQCQPGLRCLGSVCRDALVNGSPCGSTDQCGAGLVCVGLSSGSGRVCRPKTEPVAVTAACTYSVECDQGAFCENDRCTTATNRVICKQ
jgi:hypothetical protein